MPACYVRAVGAGPSVARLQLGRFEDQFFATIFMGSGYIFLGLTFGAAALAGASLASAQQDPAFASSSTYDFARLAAAQLLTVFVPKILGVFTLSQSILWLTTKVMPRWMGVIGHPGQRLHSGEPLQVARKSARGCRVSDQERSDRSGSDR